MCDEMKEKFHRFIYVYLLLLNIVKVSALYLAYILEELWSSHAKLAGR